MSCWHKATYILSAFISRPLNRKSAHEEPLTAYPWLTGWLNEVQRGLSSERWWGGGAGVSHLHRGTITLGGPWPPWWLPIRNASWVNATVLIVVTTALRLLAHPHVSPPSGLRRPPLCPLGIQVFPPQCPCTSQVLCLECSSPFILVDDSSWTSRF